MSKTTVALIAFLTGCGAAAIAPLVIPIPPAHAQTTQRWETLCVANRVRDARETPADITLTGNDAGRQGWEPFAADIAMICFKRPAP